MQTVRPPLHGSEHWYIGAHPEIFLGIALEMAEEKEGEERSLKDVYAELALDSKVFPCDSLHGEWI